MQELRHRGFRVRVHTETSGVGKLYINLEEIVRKEVRPCLVPQFGDDQITVQHCSIFIFIW